METDPSTRSTRIWRFPQQVPLQYEYEREYYFVRDCYALYYERITRWLRANNNSKHASSVTLTGSPGIGKSLFMAHCFQRLSNPSDDDDNHGFSTIILASYDSTSQLKRVAVWTKADGWIAQLACCATETMEKLMDDTHTPGNEASTLYLLDGPPNKTPPVSGKWVCFTSLDQRWMDKIGADPRHCVLYVAPWSLEELRRAATALDLHSLLEQSEDIEPVTLERVTISVPERQYLAVVRDQYYHDAVDAIDARYRIFGGTARACLSESVEFVARQYAELVRAAHSIKPHDLQGLLENGECTGILPRPWDCVVHLYPDSPPQSATSRVASLHVERLLAARLSQNN